MEFTQLSIDSQPVDGLEPFSFSTPLLQKICDGVYPLVDYLTVMFKDCCVLDALRWLNLDEAVSDIYSTLHPYDGMDPKFRFTYNGILIEFSRVFFYNMDFNLSILEHVIPRFRLDLPGSALNFLRSRGLEMYDHMRVPPSLPQGASYHFTRVDFAYDFINYAPDLFNNICDYALNNQLPSGRVPIEGLRSGLSCDVALLGRRQVTFGSAQTDRRLTFYDKRFQQIDQRSGFYKTNNCYDNPASWIRMEVRFRNVRANTIVLGVDDKGRTHNFRSVLKSVYEDYQFMSKDINGYHQRENLDFWKKLFTWEELDSRIIQNAKYVESKTPLEKLSDGVRFYAKREMVEAHMFGIRYLVDAWNAYLDSLYEPTEESLRRRVSFINYLNQIDGAVEWLHQDKEYGLSLLTGDRIYFKCSNRILDLFK